MELDLYAGQVINFNDGYALVIDYYNNSTKKVSASLYDEQGNFKEFFARVDRSKIDGIIFENNEMMGLV